jgi:hypothetical protein
MSSYDAYGLVGFAYKTASAGLCYHCLRGTHLSFVGEDVFQRISHVLLEEERSPSDVRVLRPCVELACLDQGLIELIGEELMDDWYDSALRACDSCLTRMGVTGHCTAIFLVDYSEDEYRVRLADTEDNGVDWAQVRTELTWVMVELEDELNELGADE